MFIFGSFWVSWYTKSQKSLDDLSGAVLWFLKNRFPEAYTIFPLQSMMQIK